ncbi:MAG: hypothetical protein AAB353_07280 [Candidatus Hydrogenedentota bacterium]
MRIGIALAVALACGIAGGILFARPTTDSRQVGPSSDATALEPLQQENRALRDEVAQLETQNEELSSQLFDATRAADSALADGVAEADSFDAVANSAPIDTVPEGAAGDRERRREPRWDPKNAAGNEEAIVRFNEVFGDLIQSEIEKTQDPAAIERLRALAEWRAYQDDLRRQIREAGDDPETRATLSQLMRESRDASMEILEHEQARLMADLARRHNIKDADSFSDEVREMLTSPLFDMQGLFMGRGGLPFQNDDFRNRAGGWRGPGGEAPPRQ